MKRVIAGMLTVVMMLSLIGCGGGKTQNLDSTDKETVESVAGDNAQDDMLEPFSKYPETVTITQGIVEPVLTNLPEGDTLEDNLFSRYIKDKINVEVDYAWTVAQDAYAQKVTLSIANKDMPDTLIVDELTLQQLVEADMILPLDEYYEKTLCDEIKSYYDSYNGRILEPVTFDGQIMALPSCKLAGEHMLVWVRKDWMDKLGLSEPKTLEDIKMIAKSFVENDPDGNGKDDTIGIPVAPEVAGYYNWMYLLDTVFGLYDAYPRQWIKNADGEIIYGSIAPEMKTALTEINAMYEEGIIDRQFAVRQQGNDASTLIANDQCGIFFGPWYAPYWPLNDSVKNNPDADWKPYLAPVDANGQVKTVTQNPSGEYLVISKDCENPEAVIKTLNVVECARKGFLEDAKDIISLNNGTAGVWPVNLVLDYEDAVFRYYEAIDKAIKEGNGDDLPYFYKTGYDAYIKNQESPRTNSSDWAEATARYEGQALTSGEQIARKEIAFYGKTASMELKWGMLEKMYDETVIKIIIGELPVDAFDTFVEEWKQAGGDEITQEVREMVK